MANFIERTFCEILRMNNHENICSNKTFASFQSSKIFVSSLIMFLYPRNMKRVNASVKKYLNVVDDSDTQKV